MPTSFGKITIVIEPETSMQRIVFSGKSQSELLGFIDFALKAGFISKRNVLRLLDRVQVNEE